MRACCAAGWAILVMVCINGVMTMDDNTAVSPRPVYICNSRHTAQCTHLCAVIVSQSAATVWLYVTYVTCEWTYHAMCAEMAATCALREAGSADQGAAGWPSGTAGNWRGAAGTGMSYFHHMCLACYAVGCFCVAVACVLARFNRQGQQVGDE